MDAPRTRAAGRSEVAAGARAMLPVLAGLAPAGFAVGAAWAEAGLPRGPGLLAAATVYGASAQLVLLDLASRGAAIGLIGATTAVISIRLGLLGVGVGRWLRGATARVRWLAALVLVDPAYLVADTRFATPGTRHARQHFYLGAALTLWTGWQVAHGAMLAPWVVGVRTGGGLGPDAAAFALAVPVALRTRSVGWTMAIGMPLGWASRGVL